MKKSSFLRKNKNSAIIQKMDLAAATDVFSVWEKGKKDRKK